MPAPTTPLSVTISALEPPNCAPRSEFRAGSGAELDEVIQRELEDAVRTYIRDLPLRVSEKRQGYEACRALAVRRSIRRVGHDCQ